MGKKLILTGMKFGKLLVIKEAGSVNNKIRWECICDCGKTHIANGSLLKTGKINTCGCSHIESARRNGKLADGTANIVHGLSKIPEYFVWKTMKQRCSNKNSQEYFRYGAKGVAVCERWANSFENFIKDMGRRPSDNHSIDRINPFGNYEPSNCRWATAYEQTHNRRK